MNQNSGRFNIPRLLNYYLDNIIKGKEKDVSTEDEIDVNNFLLPFNSFNYRMSCKELLICLAISKIRMNSLNTLENPFVNVCWQKANNTMKTLKSLSCPN